MSLQTEQIAYTAFLVRRRRDLSPIQFQLIPSLVTMYPWLPVLQIFVNIHLSITSLRKSNGAPVIMIPVTIVKIALLSTPTF